MLNCMTQYPPVVIECKYKQPRETLFRVAIRIGLEQVWVRWWVGNFGEGRRGGWNCTPSDPEFLPTSAGLDDTRSEDLELSAAGELAPYKGGGPEGSFVGNAAAGGREVWVRGGEEVEGDGGGKDGGRDGGGGGEHGGEETL